MSLIGQVRFEIRKKSKSHYLLKIHVTNNNNHNWLGIQLLILTVLGSLLMEKHQTESDPSKTQ